FEYHYSEGGMVFPDPLDKASRTIITGEGGKSASRFKHVVQTPKGFRRLTPIELERLNMFPDDHTELEGVSDAKRAFFMGNALVVGAVEKIGHVLASTMNPQECHRKAGFGRTWKKNGYFSPFWTCTIPHTSKATVLSVFAIREGNDRA